MFMSFLVCSIDDPVESGGVIVLWSIIMPAYNRTWGYGRTFAVP